MSELNKQNTKFSNVTQRNGQRVGDQLGTQPNEPNVKKKPAATTISVKNHMSSPLYRQQL